MYIYDQEFKLTSKVNHHMNEITRIKLSNNKTLIATADNKKNILVLNAATKEIEIDRFLFHSSKVFDLTWSFDDSYLASASLDKSIILWSVKDKNKVKTYEEMDGEVVTSVCFTGENNLTCGGYSCVLKRFNL